MKIIKVKHFSTYKDLTVFVDKSIAKGRSVNITKNFMFYTVAVIK